MPLVRLGYWLGDQAPGWPDVRMFVDAGWGVDERADVASYLGRGFVARRHLGFSGCWVCGAAGTSGFASGVMCAAETHCRTAALSSWGRKNKEAVYDSLPVIGSIRFGVQSVNAFSATGVGAVGAAALRAAGRVTSRSALTAVARGEISSARTGMASGGGISPANAARRSWANLAPNDSLAPGRVVPLDKLAGINGRFQCIVQKDGSLVVGRGGHIDLSRGRDVLGAGEVRIVGGEVRMLNNASGHYRPDGTTAELARSAFEHQAGVSVRGDAWRTVGY